MKKNIFQLNNISRKALLTIWLVFHLGIVLFFGIRLIVNHNSMAIDSDLFNLVPKSFGMESVKKADEKMLSVTGQNLFILFENEDFNKAKEAAESVYEAVSKSENFISVDLYNDVSTMGDVIDFLYDYRWNLLNEEAVNEINEPEGAEIFADNALAQAYGGFLMLPLDNLETDPFLLTEYNLQSYLEAIEKSGTAMSVKDGVLASKNDGKWYVMLRCVLSTKGATLASNDNAVSEIYDLAETLETDGIRFIYSGTPFHSHESSSSAAKEATIIATVAYCNPYADFYFPFMETSSLLCCGNSCFNWRCIFRYSCHFWKNARYYFSIWYIFNWFLHRLQSSFLYPLGWERGLEERSGNPKSYFPRSFNGHSFYRNLFCNSHFCTFRYA